MRVVQTDLFSGGRFWRETVLSRLPAHDFLTVADVALAFQISLAKVATWIEEGRLEAADLNVVKPGRRAFYRIPRRSVLRLIEQIDQGL